MRLAINKDNQTQLLVYKGLSSKEIVYEIDTPHI